MCWWPASTSMRWPSRIDLDAVAARIDVDSILDRVDLTSVARERLDLDALVRTVDIDAIVSTVDIDAIIDRLDLDALAARIDVDAILDRVDLTNVAKERLDLNALVRTVDIDAIVRTVDIDALVRTVDLDAIVSTVDIDAIIDRLDLVALANEVIAAIDLPEIIRQSSGSLASETVRNVRTQSIEADRAVERAIDRFRRQPPRQARRPAAGQCRDMNTRHPVDPASTVPAAARVHQRRGAGIVSRLMAAGIDLVVVICLLVAAMSAGVSRCSSSTLGRSAFPGLPPCSPWSPTRSSRSPT